MMLKAPWAPARSQPRPVRRAWYTAPGVGPAPGLRRRVIDVVPAVSRRRRMRWQAGTVMPGVGPTSRLQRRGRAARRGLLICAIGIAGVAAIALAKRRSRPSDASTPASPS
jgi:hypothetical protein